MRAQPAGLPRHEMALLQMVLAHPCLLDDQFEAIAMLTFTSQAVRELRDRIVAVYTDVGVIDPESLAHELRRCGHVDPLAPISGLAATEAGATREAILQFWQHRLAVHRRAVELPRELEAARRELAAEFSEQNWQRMVALHAQTFDVNTGCGNPRQDSRA